jgi:putative lipoprotein
VAIGAKMNRYLCALMIAIGAVMATARCAAAQGPAGRWLAERIRDGGVIDRIQTILEIAPGGVVSGTGGCNRMGGQATISRDTIAFGEIVSTRMACAPPVMDQEQRFFAALAQVRRWRFDPATRKLILLDADGKPLVVLAPI